MKHPFIPLLKTFKTACFLAISLIFFQCSKGNRETVSNSIPTDSTDRIVTPQPNPITKVDTIHATGVSLTGRLRAKLAKKGICGEYNTLILTGGAIDTSLIHNYWTNQFSQKTYQYAFSMKNYCDFDYKLKEGDEFYFELTSDGNKSCMSCAAWYPNPTKQLNIKVLETIK